MRAQWGGIGAGLLLMTVALGACASIEYQKVPSPVQYGDYWTIQDQKRADAMEGPRYYLPRPYVNLKQPVPVAARTAFVSFEYRARDYQPCMDGTGTYNVVPEHFALILPSDAPGWLRRTLPPRISVSQAREFFKDAERMAQARQQATGVKPDGTQPDPSTPAGERPPSSLSASVGFINKEDPQTKLGHWQDVVYLPDMDEQFVVKRNYGLGTGDLQMALRNGWAAETFGESVDNSNLIPYVLDQVQNASNTAMHIASGWGLKNVEDLTREAVDVDPNQEEATEANAAGDPNAGQQQAGGVAGTETPDGAPAGKRHVNDIDNLLGQMVLLKVVQVKIAQPGLYPILKPREIRDWFKLMYKQGGSWCSGNPYSTDADMDTAFARLLRTQGLPWINPDRVFVPAPPFTMVGFNVITDAYIGPVRKDQLGLGAYKVGGAKPDPANDPSAPNSAGFAKLADWVAGQVGQLATGVRTQLRDREPLTVSQEGQNATGITLSMKRSAASLTEQNAWKQGVQDWLESVLRTGGATTPAPAVTTSLTGQSLVAKIGNYSPAALTTSLQLD